MEMTLRWYGSKSDSVTLKQIRQIPGVTGVITTLYETAPGDLWSREEIHARKAEVNVILRPWSALAKRIFILYATISCRSLTGPAPSLQEYALTVPRYLLIARRLWTALTR